MPMLIYPDGESRTVKNLGAFFRRARTIGVKSIRMEQSRHGWLMTAYFDDGSVFQTSYADMSVFKNVLGRQRSLRGVPVTVRAKAPGSGGHGKSGGDMSVADEYEFIL